jgi:stage II sporulation protein M
MKRKEKRLFDLCRIYAGDSFSYIKESRNYIYLVIGFFVLSTLAGFYFSSQLGFLDAIIKNLLERTQNLNGIDLILFIFSNNISVAFTGLFFGILFGIFPVINSVSNGLVLGYVLSRVYIISGASEFWRILPHGIFELPAIFISLGLGIRLGMSVFSRQFIKDVKYAVVNSMKVFFFVIMPLLIVAAVIEGLLIIVLK